MQKIQDKFFMLIVLLLGAGLVYMLSPILTPFLVGTLLAYLANPLVRKLEKHQVPRLLSVIIVFLMMFVLVILTSLLVMVSVSRQVDTLITSIPNILNWLQDHVDPWLKENMGIDRTQINMESFKNVLIDNWASAGGMTNSFLKSVVASGFKFIEWSFNLILIPVVTFYLLCDWDVFIEGIRHSLPRRMESSTVKLFSEFNDVLSGFFRGQLLVMLSLTFFYSVMLSLVGLKTGLAVGFIIGILSIVPYLGFIVGLVIATLAVLLQFGGLSLLLLVWTVFMIGHVIDNAFLTPRLVGDRIGLHPVVVIFAILAGGDLFGFIGVLLALPSAALLMVWVRHLNKHYHDSELYHAKS